MSHRELSVGERAQATGCAGDHNGAFTTKVDDIAFLYGLAAREMAVHVVRVRNMEDAKKYVDAVAPNTHLRPSLCAGARYNNLCVWRGLAASAHTKDIVVVALLPVGRSIST